MAFRGGRGRGRGFGGRGGGGFKIATPVSFELFPKIDLPDRNKVPEEKKLAVLNFKFRNHFQDSPYHLDETCSEEETVDIERFSDKVNPKSRIGRESLLGSGYLKLEPGYFPIELVRGTKFKKRKVQWNRIRDQDLWKSIVKKLGGEDTKDKKEKKEGEGEDEEEEEEDVEGEEEDEVDTDDDYAKGFDYDDDEDDYNMDDGGDDEATM